METILNFITTNLDTMLMFVIILGGIFITKYTKDVTSIKNVYKVLIASILFSVIVYFIEDCDSDCLPRYLFTYLLATSFYELIVKRVTTFIENRLNK